MSNPSPPPPPLGGSSASDSHQSQEVIWKRIAREFRKEITRETRDDDDDFDDEANAIAIGIIILGLLVGAFFLIRPFFRKQPVDPVYSKLEAIKHIHDLTLVKQHYTTLIPVTTLKENRRNRGDQLEFLLRAPVQVYGNIDLNKVQFVVQEDSLIDVYLPAPDIDEPYIDIQETEVFHTGKALFQRLALQLFSRNKSYLDAYDQIVIALDSASADVFQRAIQNDIEKETLSQAELYLQSLIGSIGYRVQFYRPDDGRLPNRVPADSVSLSEVASGLRARGEDAIPSRWQLIRNRLSN